MEDVKGVAAAETSESSISCSVVVEGIVLRVEGGLKKYSLIELLI